jgi:hypothetical protein
VSYITGTRLNTYGSPPTWGVYGSPGPLSEYPGRLAFFGRCVKQPQAADEECILEDWLFVCRCADGIALRRRDVITAGVGYVQAS